MTATFFKNTVGLKEEYVFIEWRSDGKFEGEVRVLTGKEEGAANAKHLYTRSAKTLPEAEGIFNEICAEYRFTRMEGRLLEWQAAAWRNE